jgi:cell division septal protein FtsQ
MRWLYRGVIVILAVILIAFVYQRVFGGKTVEPHLVSSEPVAVIGSGSEAVAVADDGTVLTWLALPEDLNLPQLPLSSTPKGPRVEGSLLEQVRVLAAVPPALQQYVAGSHFGESGVDVELSSGIELIFGSAGDAERKWRAAAAVLADPSITALDYVNLLAPGRPTVGGSGHTLPPIK